MSSKTLKMLLGASLGVAGAAAVSRWPNHAVLLQMSLYSAMILLPLSFFFWTDRHRPRFWMGTALILLLHAMLLLGIHSMFPFRTILVVLPILLIEGILLAILMIKLLGDENTGEA